MTVPVEVTENFASTMEPGTVDFDLVPDGTVLRLWGDGEFTPVMKVSPNQQYTKIPPRFGVFLNLATFTLGIVRPEKTSDFYPMEGAELELYYYESEDFRP